MNPRRPHHHECQSCGAITECWGQLVQNHDGHPWIICREYHLDGGIVNRDFLCEACAETQAAAYAKAEQFNAD